MLYRVRVCFYSTASGGRIAPPADPYWCTTEAHGETWSVKLSGTPLPLAEECVTVLEFLVDCEATRNLPRGEYLTLYEGPRRVGWATVLEAP